MNEKTVRKAATREELAQRILAGCGIFGGLLGAGLALMDKLNVEVPWRAMGMGLVVVMVIAAFVTWLYWRLIDEAAQAAHKFAWFWGGQGGMVVALAAGVFANSTKLTEVYGDLGAAGWLYAGMVVLLSCQIVGYALAWAGWWLVRRR